MCDPLSFIKVTIQQGQDTGTSLPFAAGKAKTQGLQSGVDIEVKRQQEFHDGTRRASQCVTELQTDTSTCASQSAMTAFGIRRRLYDPENHTLESAAPSASQWAPSVPAR